MSSDKIKLVRFSNVVPFGPGPGVREVQGGQPGVSLAVEPGLLVMCKVVKDSGGNTVHTTKVPLAHCTCIVYEPKREQLVTTPEVSSTLGEKENRRAEQEKKDALTATRQPAQQSQVPPEPEDSAEPTSEIVLEDAEKPTPAAAKKAAPAKPKANKPSKS